MPYVLLGPALSILGFALLHVSVHGVPSALRGLAGTPTPQLRAFANSSRARVSWFLARYIRQPQVTGTRGGARAARPRRKPAPAKSGREVTQFQASMAVLVALAAGLGSGYALGTTMSDAAPEPPTNTIAGVVTTTPVGATATAAPARTAAVAGAAVRQDCSDIRGTEYRSEAERSWYLETCVQVEEAARMWTLPLSLCASGLAFSIEAVGDAPRQGARVFCVQDNLLVGPDGLQVMGPFACPGGRPPAVAPGRASFSGREVGVQELICPTA